MHYTPPHPTHFQKDHSIEAQQERLNFQAARILEVNQQLQTLIDSSDKVRAGISPLGALCTKRWMQLPTCLIFNYDLDVMWM